MSTFDLDNPQTDPIQAAEAAAQVYRELTGIDAFDIALILGSGWNGSADLIGETVADIPATEVPGFLPPIVEGHAGTLRAVKIGDTGKHALAISARTHYYEDRGIRRVAHGVRFAAALGCSTIVITNGSGGVRPEYDPGTVLVMSDHLNLTFDSPLEGAQFVDLSSVYTPRLRELIREVDPTLTEGVYAQFRGPHYETPAEVVMARTIGADAVGMSTALEAIAATERGMEILGLSLVTTPAAGVTGVPLTHEEVLAAGEAAAPRVAKLVADFVQRWAQ